MTYTKFVTVDFTNRHNHWLDDVDKNESPAAVKEPAATRIELPRQISTFQITKGKQIIEVRFVNCGVELGENNMKASTESAESNLPPGVLEARDQFRLGLEGLLKDRKDGKEIDEDDTKGRLTDKKIYSWLVEYYKLENKICPLHDYDTWTRYLRIWRKTTDNRKNTPRGGRAESSGSIDHLEKNTRPNRIEKPD